MHQMPPPAPPSPPPSSPTTVSNMTTSKFAQQNASLLAQVREQNQQMRELREERDKLLDHVTSISAKHSTFQAMTEENVKLGHEVDKLKRELKQKDEELIIALRKKDKERLTVNDEHIALTNENARLKTLKDQLFVAVKDRDTKIANLETAFKDLRQKYYEMIQEVETSKSLAMAIKRVAEEGAIVAHSTNIRKKQVPVFDNNRNNYSVNINEENSPQQKIQNLPNMNQIYYLNRRQQNINYRQSMEQQEQQYEEYQTPNDSPSSSLYASSFQQQQYHPNGYADRYEDDAFAIKMDQQQRQSEYQQQSRQQRGKYIEEYDDEIISYMDKKELQLLRRKSQVGNQQPNLDNASQTSPKLQIRHTNGSYNKKNLSKVLVNNKKKAKNKNIAFGKTNQRIGRASWIVHKDANYFINNSSIESKKWREFNTNSPKNGKTSSSGF